MVTILGCIEERIFVFVVVVVVVVVVAAVVVVVVGEQNGLKRY